MILQLTLDTLDNYPRYQQLHQQRYGRRLKSTCLQHIWFRGKVAKYSRTIRYGSEYYLCKYNFVGIENWNVSFSSEILFKSWSTEPAICLKHQITINSTFTSCKSWQRIGNDHTCTRHGCAFIWIGSSRTSNNSNTVAFSENCIHSCSLPKTFMTGHLTHDKHTSRPQQQWLSIPQHIQYALCNNSNTGK